MYNKIFKIYNNSDSLCTKFKEQLLDMSLEKFTVKNKNWIYERLCEQIFKEQDFEVVQTLVKSWIEITKADYH